MKAVIILKLERRTLATLRKAELGLRGVLLKIDKQVPYF
jgi:hypothetical protein